MKGWLKKKLVVETSLSLTRSGRTIRDGCRRIVALQQPLPANLDTPLAVGPPR